MPNRGLGSEKDQNTDRWETSPTTDSRQAARRRSHMPLEKEHRDTPVTERVHFTYMWAYFFVPAQLTFQARKFISLNSASAARTRSADHLNKEGRDKTLLFVGVFLMGKAELVVTAQQITDVRGKRRPELHVITSAVSWKQTRLV